MSENDTFVEGVEPDPFDPIVQQSQREAAAKQFSERNKAVLDVLLRRKEAYQRLFVFGNTTKDDVALVMDDLKMFCRGDQSAFHVNERFHTLLTGRQEVFLRIQDFTRLSLDELYDNYTRKPQD